MITTPHRSRLLQRIGLVLSALLGMLAGLLFAFGPERSLRFIYATFLWSLIIATAVTLIAAHSGRITLGNWRAGLRMSSVVYLGQTSVYVLLLLLCASLGAGVWDASESAAPASVLLRVAVPTCYILSLVMIAVSMLFYRPPSERF